VKKRRGYKKKEEEREKKERRERGRGEEEEEEEGKEERKCKDYSEGQEAEGQHTLIPCNLRLATTASIVSFIFIFFLCSGSIVIGCCGVAVSCWLWCCSVVLLWCVVWGRVVVWCVHEMGIDTMQGHDVQLLSLKFGKISFSVPLLPSRPLTHDFRASSRQTNGKPRF
jgi:hypothetical protein